MQLRTTKWAGGGNGATELPFFFKERRGGGVGGGEKMKIIRKFTQLHETSSVKQKMMEVLI